MTVRWRLFVPNGAGEPRNSVCTCGDLSTAPSTISSVRQNGLAEVYLQIWESYDHADSPNHKRIVTRIIAPTVNCLTSNMQTALSTTRPGRTASVSWGLYDNGMRLRYSIWKLILEDCTGPKVNHVLIGKLLDEVDGILLGRLSLIRWSHTEWKPIAFAKSPIRYKPFEALSTSMWREVGSRRLILFCSSASVFAVLVE